MKVISAVREFAERHPRLASWILLAAGMVVMLLIASRDVGLQPTQLATLVVATIVLAGLCVWIINWGEEGDLEEAFEDSEGEVD
jgi:protein-S-isoprenylcysteine O-methyltransferase Ste14